MKLNSLKIIRSAPSIQLQDLGRFGVAHHGLSQGGALDLHAHCWANRLLENSIECSTLEILIGNTEILATQDSNISLTGAEVNVSIDGKKIDNWSSFILKKNQHLKIGYAKTGLRIYLGIKGGFASEPILESISTVLRNDIGSNLTEDSILESPSIKSSLHNRTPSNFIPKYKNIMTVRVITNEASSITDNTFTVTPNSDRTGIRFHSDAAFTTGSGIISEPNALGAIQLPPDGQPIILLNDRQTQGGYQKLGHIAKIDLAIIAQARPGTKIRFKKTSLTEAREAWMIFLKFFSK